MMNCKARLANLGELVEGTTSLGRRMTFYLHIAMCPRCRLYFRQFKQMKLAAEEVLPEDLPDDFFQVMDRALKRIEPQS